MTERGTIVRPPIRPLSEKRRKRIERELRALRTMEGALGTREMWWAVVTIPAVAALCIIIAFKVQWFGGSVLASIIGALAMGALVWWIGRRWFVIAALIVMALAVLAFEGGDLGDPGFGDKKEARRRKLKRAIARREQLLRTAPRAQET